MTDFKTPLRLALVLALGAALPAVAQDAAPAAPAETPAPAAEAPADAPAADAPAAAETPAEEGGIGQPYVAATHGDWQQRCLRTESGADPCQLYQLLNDDRGNAVAEFSMFGLPEGQEAVAGATIMAPLETLLTEAVILQIDSGEAKRYGFTFCAQQGCVARVGFTQAELDAFRRGNEATVAITPLGAPDQRVALKLSLRGFTAGFEAVEAANERANAAAAAAPSGN